MKLTTSVIILLVLFLSSINAADEKPKFPCHVAEYVYEHKEEYIDDKLSCKFYRCDNGTWIEGYRACVFNGQCFPVDKRWTYRCHKMQCIEDRPSQYEQVYRTIITSPECMFEGQCKKRGSVWKDNCVSYKCHFNVTDSEDGPIYEEQIIPEASCKWGNRCFKRGETMTKDCLTYKCSVNINPSNTIHRGMRLEERGCYGLNNRKSCIPYGQDEIVGCSTYQCQQEGNYVMMVLKKYGCKNTNGTCVYSGYKHNPTACIQQTCTKQGWTSNLYACAYNKLCIPEGNTYYDDEECTNRTCTLTRKGKGKKKKVTMQMKITESGCPDKESGTCKKNKEIWTDKHCTKRVCKSKVLRNGEAKSKIDIKEASCMDADGKCQPIGTKDFSAIVDGVEYDNCRCSRKGRYGTALSCQMSKEVIHS